MSEHSEVHATLRFLSRAEMWPSQINAGYPGARFLARARIAAGQIPVAGYFAGVVTDGVWGLLITTADGAGNDQVVTVTTDDGRQLSAVMAGDTLLEGDPQGVLAAARYWELPPHFVTQLKLALRAGGEVVEEEEPRDDGSLG